MTPAMKTTNALAWAAAILASAILEAPSSLTLILLPSLALVTQVTGSDRTPPERCRTR